mgnify:CR=1 FL=1|jgi:bifunctional UDP-N-acetylglucosamine pyrophosphorylase/glucosamine-1-phosphate N-acetyltransferase
MQMDTLTIAILAAGQGARMRSKLPKVLHPVGGRPMLQRVLDVTSAVGAARICVVCPPLDSEAGRAIATAVGERALLAEQREPRGTGHAVLQAQAVLEGHGTDLAVVYGDTPLLQAETLRALVDLRRRTSAAVALLTAIVDNPAGYGRVLRRPDGTVYGVVEHALATAEQRAIREINTGVMCLDADWAWPRLAKLPPRPGRAGTEYFLPDLVTRAVEEGRPVVAHVLDDPDEAMGIDDRVRLAEAEAALRRRINHAHMLQGVTITDPATTYIEEGVLIGRDTVILPHTYISSGTVIGEDCRIGPHSYIRASRIGARCIVWASVVEEAILDDDVQVGPFSHLRPGAHLEQGVHVGNYAEVKNSLLGTGVAMHHFGYIGDATVGAYTNIGAGTVTCNFDGRRKHRTVIGEGAFIGSDSILVAPVEVGAGALTGAGSVVTRDVPPGAKVYGVPARVHGEARHRSED